MQYENLTRCEMARDSSVAHGRWLINLDPDRALQDVMLTGRESKRLLDVGQLIATSVFQSIITVTLH